MTLLSKTYWAGAPFRFGVPPEGAGVQPRILRTEDFRDVRVLFWTPPAVPRPRAAVVAMHPRVDFTSHYAFPRLLAAGYGCLGAISRGEGNDTVTVHEELLLDLAACVRWLKEQQGVEQVVLLGNSGGGSLAAFYQAEALAPAAERTATMPWGASSRLPGATLPAADAMIYVAAHPGQGSVCMECIDPSVTDERDPWSRDPALDMFDPANGFAEPPLWSEYAPGFVERYRAAQRERVARLDAVAREWIAGREQAQREMRVEGFAARTLAERREVWRRADCAPVMVIYRTGANLHYTTRQLDPQDRDYGSLLSERPDRLNDTLLGWARTCTPEAWLSTWSGLSSRADLARNVARIGTPTLLVHAGRDKEILFDSHVRPVWDAIAAEDRTLHTIKGAGHYFEPATPGDASRPHTEALMDVVVAWLSERMGRPAVRSQGPDVQATAPVLAREPAAATWVLPAADRAPLPAPLRRTNLRVLAARPGRFEHHLVVVGTIGPTQIELATASEPLYYAHRNCSDELILPLPSGDKMIDAVPILTLISSFETGADVARYKHRTGDVVLNPYGYLHWPGRLRPPYEPFAFPPGGRRAGLTAVFCANRESVPAERPLFVSAGREADAKIYSREDVPLLLADTTREACREIARVAGVTMSLAVDPARIAAPRGAMVLVLDAPQGGDLEPCDLVYIPEGAELPGSGIARALVFASPEFAPDPPPVSWEQVAAPPFAVAEDVPRGALPVVIGALRIEALGDRSVAGAPEGTAGAGDGTAGQDKTVRVSLGEAAAEVPRYWLARMLFRAALHDFALGWLETYGGFTYDDRHGDVRLGLRGAGHVSVPREEALGVVERAYRAVAPEGYVERLR